MDLGQGRAKGLPTNRHLTAAIDWGKFAHAAAGDGVFLKDHDLWRDRWSPSYPETTGYTIASLLNVAIYAEPTRVADAGPLCGRLFAGAHNA
jgi:hypothetical protein